MTCTDRGLQPAWRPLSRTRLAAGLILSVLVIAKSASSAPLQTAPPPTRADIERRIEGIREWLVAARTDSAANGRTVGSARTIEVRRGADGQTTSHDGATDWQGTAVCKTLEFLSLYGLQRGLDGALQTDIRRLVALLRSAQSADLGALHFGALASDSTQRQYVSFTNAVCGHALLAAHRATGEVLPLTMAKAVAEYHLRLLAEGDRMSRRAEGRTGRPVAFSLFDRVTSSGRIQVTSSTWNLAAAPFLSEVATLTGNPAYRHASERIAAFLWHGLASGHDYFSAAFDASDDARLLLSWNLGYVSKGSERKHDFADGQWHRHGDIRSPPSGSVGTDQIEYGLAAWHTLRPDTPELKAIYLKYRSLPTDPPCLDMGLSFSGYFRLFDGEGSARNAHLGRYYDIVGAGILAAFKQRHFVADHDAAVRAMLVNREDWAMLGCDLQPVWTAKNGTQIAKRSTLVAATSGIALLAALVTSPPANAAVSRPK